MMHYRAITNSPPKVCLENCVTFYLKKKTLTSWTASHIFPFFPLYFSLLPLFALNCNLKISDLLVAARGIRRSGIFKLQLRAKRRRVKVGLGSLLFCYKLLQFQPVLSLCQRFVKKQHKTNAKRNLCLRAVLPSCLLAALSVGRAFGFSCPEASGSPTPTSTPCIPCCSPSFLTWPSAIMKSPKSPGMSTLAWPTSWRSAVCFLLPGFYQKKKQANKQNCKQTIEQTKPQTIINKQQANKCVCTSSLKRWWKLWRG